MTGLADIDAVKAAATVRTEEKRIVCEDVMWVKLIWMGQ
jgi:hypothetical protein